MDTARARRTRRSQTLPECLAECLPERPPESAIAPAGTPVTPAGPDLPAFALRFLDPTSYRDLHADLREQSEAHQDLNLPQHFLQYGLAEGRQPSHLFDTAHVARLLSRLGRREVAATEAMSVFHGLAVEHRFVPNRWFGAWAFRQLHADHFPLLADCTDYEAFECFVAHAGTHALSPNGLFNEAAYRERYPDVAAAIASRTQRCGFLHFVATGYRDVRRNLPGLPASGTTPAPALERAFLLRELAETTRIVPWFDEEFYLSLYDDVHILRRRGQILCGLEHFMVRGFREGRLPHPGAGALLARTKPYCADDAWVWAETVAAEALGTPRLPLDEASRLLRALDLPASRKQAVQAALWRFIDPPPVRGTVDTTAYLAINTDVAATFGTDHAGAQRHWQEFGAIERRAAPGSNLFATREIRLADVASWRSGVNFFGPLSASSGLGEAARGYLAALRAAGIPVATFDVSGLFREDLPSDIFSAQDLPYSINFFLLNADQVVPFAMRWGCEVFDRRANVGAWVWEMPSPRIEWRAALSAFDLIVVPSAFCAASIATSTARPLSVIPYVLSAEVLHRQAALPSDDASVARVAAARAAGRRIVLFVMDASSYIGRKGLDLYLELARRVELARPGECLFVVKSHSRDVSGGVIATAASESLLVIDEILDFAVLCRLRALADVYVSPHRSEGFGLNIFESIMLGVRTVCSAYAGGVDRLGPDYPYLVSGRLTEVGRDMGPYMSGSIWFEPDAEDLERKLLAALDDADDPAFAKLGRRLATELSTDSVGATLRSALEMHCALGAESAPDSIARFAPLSRVRHDETFVLGYPDPTVSPTPPGPGLERLGEVFIAARTPYFSVITPCWNSEPRWLDELYADLLAQDCPSWEWCLVDDASTRDDTRAALEKLRSRDSRIKLARLDRNAGIARATNAAVTLACGRYIVLVDHDDRVSPVLLSSYLEAVRCNSETAGVLYCDEDKIDQCGRPCEDFHKPDWSPEHATSTMFVLHCLAIRKSLFLSLGGYDAAFEGAQDHDLLLRAAARGATIVHVDRLLYHWRISPGSAAFATDAKSDGVEAGRRAVAAHLDRLGLAGTVEHGTIRGTFRMRPLPGPGKVALLVLTGMTRDPASPGGIASFAEGFVRSILRHAPAIAFEIQLVVDSPAVEMARPLEALDGRIRVVPYVAPGGGFNFAHKANWAVRQAGTDRVVLLNDDMQAVDDAWLPALLEMLELPGVGIVGGKLVYQDGRIQHCGVVMGVHGACTHLFAGMPPGHNSYNLFAHVIRNYSAVTGAMLAFRRSTFERVRGFDENYPVDYNDIDFCLRAQEAGLRVVYTPYATLRHFESCSAIRLAADALDTARFARRWSARIARDPYYNRNLTRSGAMCEPATPDPATFAA